MTIKEPTCILNHLISALISGPKHNVSDIQLSGYSVTSSSREVKCSRLVDPSTIGCASPAGWLSQRNMPEYWIQASVCLNILK